MSNSAKLRKAFPQIDWQEQVPLAPYTYMKVGGPAEIFWIAKDREMLVAVISWCQENDIPITILGGASNVLIDDLGVEGLVIINQCAETALLGETELSSIIDESWWAHFIEDTVSYKLFVADSGIKTALLVRYSVDLGLTGLEPFLGVPGTLGGAVYNNSHYTNELIGNHILAVEVLDEKGRISWLNQEDCAFGYDDSRFHRTKEIILRVIFALQSGEKSVSDAAIREATLKRATTQPLGTANSGCMFRNVTLPAERQAEYDGKSVLSAGWLIDQAGLKGERVGGAVVSDKHANFIVNDGSATAQDIRLLVEKVQQAVKAKFGVDLEREVFFIGEK